MLLKSGWIIVFVGTSGGVDRYARLDGSPRLALWPDCPCGRAGLQSTAT